MDSRERLEGLASTLSELIRTFEKKIIFSLHPRTRKRLAEFEISLPEGVDVVAPLGFFDYAKLQTHAYCVVSDSGTLTEEAAILGFPAVMIREAHERPEGMDEGTLLMAGLNSDRIIDAVSMLRKQSQDDYRIPSDYTSLNVSSKVVRIILSYTDFVNRVIWSK